MHPPMAAALSEIPPGTKKRTQAMCAARTPTPSAVATGGPTQPGFDDPPRTAGDHLRVGGPAFVAVVVTVLQEFAEVGVFPSGCFEVEGLVLDADPQVVQ